MPNKNNNNKKIDSNNYSINNNNQGNATQSLICQKELEEKEKHLKRQQAQQFSLQFSNFKNLPIKKQKSERKETKFLKHSTKNPESIKRGFSFKEPQRTFFNTSNEINNNNNTFALAQGMPTLLPSKVKSRKKLPSAILTSLQEITKKCTEDMSQMNQDEVLALFEQIRQFPMEELNSGSNQSRILADTQAVLFKFLNSPHRSNTVLSQKIKRCLNIFFQSCRSSSTLGEGYQYIAQEYHAQVNLAFSFEPLDIKNIGHKKIHYEQNSLSSLTEHSPPKMRALDDDAPKTEENISLIDKKIKTILAYLSEGYTEEVYNANFSHVMNTYKTLIYCILDNNWSDYLSLDLCGKTCLEKLLLQTDPCGNSWLHKIIDYNDTSLLIGLLEHSQTMQIDLTPLTDIHHHRTLLQHMIDQRMFALVPLLLKSFDVHKKNDAGQSALDDIFSNTKDIDSMAPLATLITSGIINFHDDRIKQISRYIPNFYQTLYTLCPKLKESFLHAVGYKTKETASASITISENSYDVRSPHFLLAHPVPTIEGDFPTSANPSAEETSDPALNKMSIGFLLN